MKALITSKNLFVVLFVCSQAETLQFQQFTAISSKRVEAEFIYFTDKVGSLLQCSAQCVGDGRCKSALFNSNDRFCHLTSYAINNQNGLTEDPSWRAISRDCFADWMKIEDICYYVTEDQKTYSDAEKFCEEHGGKLAEPQSYEKFELLRTYLVGNRSGSQYRFGLIDLVGNDTFVWRSNGKVPTYTAWGYGKPDNNSPSEDCVILHRYHEYKWNDDTCHDKRGFVCER